MAAFSATQSALEGFRLVGRKPISFLVWAATLGALLVLLGWAVLQYAIPWINGFKGMKEVAPDQVWPLVSQIGGAYLVALVVLIAWEAVVVNAILRAVIRPKGGGLAHMQLGGDELRFIGLLLLIVLIYLALVAVCAMGGILLFSQIQPVGAGFGLAALIVLALWTFLWIGVRLSLAAALIVDKHRLDLGAAWSLTRGRFWPLLGMWIIAFLLATAISMVVQVFTQPISANLQMAIGDGQDLDLSSFFNTSPAMIAAGVVLFSVISTLQMIVQVAPGAAAYRALTSGDPAAPADASHHS